MNFSSAAYCLFRRNTVTVFLIGIPILPFWTDWHLVIVGFVIFDFQIRCNDIWQASLRHMLDFIATHPIPSVITNPDSPRLLAWAVFTVGLTRLSSRFNSHNETWVRVLKMPRYLRFGAGLQLFIQVPNQK